MVHRAQGSGHPHSYDSYVPCGEMSDHTGLKNSTGSRVPGSIAQLSDALRESPATVPALGAIMLFVVWAADQAGYPLTHWAPGGLIVLVLLAIAIFSVPPRLGDVPVAVRVALVCLVLYTALSFLSILWAGVRADAWEGANRTLLYLMVFALFALWPQRGASAAILLGTWVLAMIGLAVFVMLHVEHSAGIATLFSEGRLMYPAGYENANAAMWAMVMWPAFLLAVSDRIPWGLRGVFAGGTVVLADLALLSLSRGALYTTPVMLVLVFALVPGRLRSFVVLVPIALSVGITTPAVLRVGDRLLDGGNAKAALHTATVTVFAAALLAGLVVAAGGALERRITLSRVSLRRVRMGVGTIAIATLVAVIGGGWIAAGDPVARIEHGWKTFKGGYAADRKNVNRLVSGLGSGRYDFYRVALDEFAAHPLVGIGADNFQQPYLRHGRGESTPHYPHSVELRTLAQTGLVGALLAVVGLGAALLAGGRAGLLARARRSDPLGAAVATAALGGFAYWMVHGSFDWFWEFAGLGAPAFALLGLACALTPRGEATTQAKSAPASALAGMLIGVVVALIAAASLIAPWLSRLQVENAARIWSKAPATAYARLSDAARLNPLSDEPYLVAGSIALRFGDLARADHQFALALERTPDDAYATLERGAIASARGDRASALALLRRAVYLNPRDPLTHEALSTARRGERVNITELNRFILLQAKQLA